MSTLLPTLFVLCLSAGLPTYGQQPAAAVPCQAWLSVQQEADFITLTGHCRSLTPAAGHYQYVLELERRSAGGQSTSQQSGHFTLSAGQAIVLSSTRVNVDGRTAYFSRLRVLTDTGRLLAQDSLRHGPATH